MEIIIGREAGRARLCLEVNGKQYFSGNDNYVPKGVSRWNHCKIVVDGESMVVENLKPESNKVYVDGLEIIKKIVPLNSRVELGECRFFLNLPQLLPLLSKSQGGTFGNVGGNGGGAAKPERKSFSIRHLQRVYENYHNDMLQFQIKNGRQTALQSITGVLSPLALVLAIVPIPELTVFRPVLYVLMVVLAAVFAWSRYKSSSENPLYLDKLNRQFHEDYVCPNPDCRVFLGNLPYDDLKKVGRCIHCQSHFEDK